MKYDLALILKSKKRVSEVKKHLILIFSENNIIKGSQIIDLLRGYCTASERESILYSLKENGILLNVKPAPSIHDYQFKLNSKDIDLFFTCEENAAEVLEKYLERTCEPDENVVSFVSTVPSEFLALSKKTDQIEPALIRLISKATKTLWIVNPFFDKFGATIILDALLGAAKQGVHIKIMSRDYLENPNQKESLQYIASEFEKNGLLESLEYRDLFLRSENGKQIYALHSKLLVSDLSAYIGSANLTEHSMRNNFELGVIIYGTSILPVIDLVEKMWNYATRVKIIEI